MKSERRINRLKAKERAESDAYAERMQACVSAEGSRAELYNFHFGQIVDCLPNCSMILEVGCGIGELTVYLEKHFESVCGVDSSHKSLVVAQRGLKKAPGCLYVSEGERLPFADARFDGIVLRGVIHHLPYPDQVLNECMRVLKPGGKLVIFEGNIDSIYRKLVLGLSVFLGMNTETSPFNHRPASEILQMIGGNENRVRSVSGLMAPVCLLGLPGRSIWRCLIGFDRLMSAVNWPIFNWYYLIESTKSH
ncbi:MAG: hypothetical protein CL483_03915 [Acidobacteria bacterium]|nr:hypothetical protein [Acidobacteriota bacterium]|tara:strand:- start:328 stop:1077 length:750 start_codon:yes stop_codon:yes gene_type:complete